MIEHAIRISDGTARQTAVMASLRLQVFAFNTFDALASKLGMAQLKSSSCRGELGEVGYSGGSVIGVSIGIHTRLCPATSICVVTTFV